MILMKREQRSVDGEVSLNDHRNSMSDISALPEDGDEITNTPLRIVIAGSDAYVNHVLRPFVDICSRKPRGWQMFRFYLIPIGKKIDLAIHLASFDPVYRSMFFSGGLFHTGYLISLQNGRIILTKRKSLKVFTPLSFPTYSIEEARDVAKRVHKYIEEASSVHGFEIAEAMLKEMEQNTTTTQRNVPFLKVFIQGNFTEIIKGLQIGEKDSDSDTADLQLDYWVNSKKGEMHKSIKSFELVAITRLPAVANALNIEPEYRPTSSTFALIVHQKDKSKKIKVKG